jgi:FkbM family methyltransferase
MEIFKRLLSALPINVDIVGHNRDLVLYVVDHLYSNRGGVKQIYGDNNHVINLDLSFSNERVLYYAFNNIIRKYKKSDLYAVLKQYIGDDTIFIDIGANLGIYSLLAKELGAYTVLFEPEPRHYSFLSRNKSIFDEVYCSALSNFEGKSMLFVAKDNNLGGNSLVASNNSWEESGYESEIEVAVDRFDNFLSRSSIDLGKVACIKIDVEGNEYETVCGMENYLEDGYKPVIWCEVRGPTSDRNPNSQRKVIDFLSEFDYMPYRVKNKKKTPFFPENEDLPQVFDLLFLRKTQVL